MECCICHSAISDESVYCPHCATQIPDVEECQDYTYEAFISYRHRDLDRGIAKRLQRFLEGLRAPKQLETIHTRKRLGKLFRDEDELPTSSSLSEQIEKALKHSRYLVVVCSPQARESLWVQREVELFASLHGRDRIILALTEGEPEDSFPPLLLHRNIATLDGTIQQVEEEPIAADFRATGQKRFKDEALRIAAALFGCNYDELRQRMRVRRMRAIAIAAAAIAMVSIAFGTFSFYQQMQIQKNHRTSQIHESELLAVESDRLLKQGDRYQAIQVALRALPESSGDNSRPIVPAALLALQRALEVFPTNGLWSPDYSLPLSCDNAFLATDEGYLITVTNSEDIEVYNLALGTKTYTIEKAELFPEVDANELRLSFMDERNGWLVCTYGNAVWCFDADIGKPVWNAQGNYKARSGCAGDDTITIMYSDGNEPSAQKNTELVTYNIESGAVLQTYKLDNSNSQSYELIACDRSGKRISYLRNDGMLFILDLSGKTESAQTNFDLVHDIRFEKDRIYVLAGNESILPNTVSIEAFDANLNPQWTHEEHIVTQWNDLGETEYGSLEFCGIDASGEYPSNLVVSLNTELAFLDPATGSLISKSKYESPILDCRLLGEDYYEGVLANGTAFLQPGIEDGTRIQCEDLTTCTFAASQVALINGVGVFVVGKSLAPTKLATFHYGDGFIASFAAQEADWLDGDARVVSDNGNYALVGKDAVTFLDNSTLKPRASIDAKSLPDINWNSTIHVVFGDSDEAYLWAGARSGNEDVALYRISIGKEKCEVMSLTTLEDAIIESYSITEIDDRLHVGDDDIVWQGDDRLVLLDKDTLSSLREIPTSNNNAIDCARNGRSTALICERHPDYEQSLGRYRLVDKSTGNDIPSDIQEYAFHVTLSSIGDPYSLSFRLKTSMGASPAVDAAYERVALPCSDGRIRVFDLADGSLIWESSEVSPHLAFLHFTAQGDLLIQDEQGYCSLLSSEGGAIIASTTLTMPPFNKAIYSDDSTAVITYSAGLAGRGGASIVLTDRDAFGPIVDMPLGVAIAQSENAYLAYDGSAYKTYPLMPLEIDRLLELANHMIEGHELTEAESALYQVDE